MVESIEQLANDIKKALRRTVDLARSAKKATAATTAPEALIALQDELIATRSALLEARSEVERGRIEHERTLAEIMNNSQENAVTLERERSSKQIEIQRLDVERNSLKENLDTANNMIVLLNDELSKLKTHLAASHRDSDEKPLGDPAQQLHTTSSETRLADFSSMLITNSPASDIAMAEILSHRNTYPSNRVRNVFGSINDSDISSMKIESSLVSMFQLAKNWGKTPDGKALILGAFVLLVFIILIISNNR